MTREDLILYCNSKQYLKMEKKVFNAYPAYRLGDIAICILHGQAVCAQGTAATSMSFEAVYNLIKRYEDQLITVDESLFTI